METLNYLFEEWRDIKGYEGLYQVSSLGRVRSVDKYIKAKSNSLAKRKGKLMKEALNKDSYHYVVLVTDNYRKKYYVHRLVAVAFPEICGEWFEGAEINHIDENRENNKATNLEWCSKTYNNKYGNRGRRVAKSHSKTIIQFSKNGEFIKEWGSATEASKVVGGHRELIYSCLKYRKKSAYGYIWRYKKKQAYHHGKPAKR